MIFSLLNRFTSSLHSPCPFNSLSFCSSKVSWQNFLIIITLKRISSSFSLSGRFFMYLKMHFLSQLTALIVLYISEREFFIVRKIWLLLFCSSMLWRRFFLRERRRSRRASRRECWRSGLKGFFIEELAYIVK